MSLQTYIPDFLLRNTQEDIFEEHIQGLNNFGQNFSEPQNQSNADLHEQVASAH